MGVTEGTFWELSSVWPDNWSHPCHLDRLLGNSMTWKILILVPKGKHFLSSFIVYPKTTFSYKVQDMAVSIHHLALSFHRPDIPWHFLWLNSCCWILYSMEKCDLCKEKYGKVHSTTSILSTFILHMILCRCIDCKESFMSSDFNTSKSAIHCFEYCFTSEARLGYTLFFLLLPIVFYLTEFLTLTDR